MSDTRVALLIFTMSIVTIILRSLPFILIGDRKTPKIISYLGDVLPYSVMGLLVVYCFRNIDFTHSPFALPELIAGLITAISFIIKRNTLLSIISGTICYMLLIQVVFA